jgi:beta-phosphoglucomutase-like phosphatase (HAD superfamily)
VVFDLDGVLVLSEHLWEEAWVAYASRFGSPWTPSDTRACQGLSVPEWGAYLAARTSGDVADAIEAVIESVASAYEAGRVEPADGAGGLVEAVASLVPVGLASSAPRRIIDTVVRTMEFGRLLKVTVSSAEVPRGKPSPDVYLAAIERMGIDPAVSLGVEDSSNGIRAAHAAGLTVIAVAHEQYPIALDARGLTAAVHTDLAGVREELLGRLKTDRHRAVEVAR